MFHDGAQAIEGKNYLLHHSEVAHVTLEGQTYYPSLKVTIYIDKILVCLLNNLAKVKVNIFSFQGENFLVDELMKKQSAKTKKSEL